MKLAIFVLALCFVSEDSRARVVASCCELARDDDFSYLVLWNVKRGFWVDGLGRWRVWG